MGVEEGEKRRGVPVHLEYGIPILRGSNFCVGAIFSLGQGTGKAVRGRSF